MILHTVNRSTALKACLQLASADSAILLMEDAVYAALDNELITLLKDHKQTFYILEADAFARGLSTKIDSEFTLISYTEFVALSLQYSKVQSWS